jgi:hypothetical protein
MDLAHTEWERASENPQVRRHYVLLLPPPGSTSTEQSPGHGERKESRHALFFSLSHTHSGFPERQNLSCHTGFHAATMRQQPF